MPSPPSMISQAFKPFTSYPETYTAMNREALEQMERGVGQLTSAPTGGLGETAWEKIKGVGNVGLGALGYLYSPLSAGLRTVVGNPLQETTGLPREYSEFAAGLALPGVGLRPVGIRPPRPGPSRDVADAAARQGVNIPRAAATENIPIQATAGAVKEMPIVGTPLVEASRESQRGMEAAARRTVGEYGSGEATIAGQRASEGIQNWITGRSREINERIYGAVDNLVDPNYTAPLNNTQAEVAQIMARRANARISGVSRAVDEVTDALTSPMNYDGVKTLRTYIGEMTPQEMVAKGITKQEAEAIYRGLSRDLRDIVQGAGGQPALAAWERANAVAQQIFQRRSDLAKIVGAAGDATPESVVQRIIGMAGSKKGADYATLVQARRAMGPDAWDDVASAIVNQMGHTKPGRDWSGAIFKASWDAMTPASRRLLFGSTGRPDSMQAIQDLVTMSNAYDRLAKFANPSGTSRAVTLFGMASAAWAAPLETLASAVGSNVMARFLASPVTARWGTRWGVAYTNAMRNPTPQRMGLLADEANRLSGVISSQLGVTIPPSAFMPGAANASEAPPIDLPEVEVSPTHHQHGGEVPGAQRPELPYIGEVELPPADVVPSPGPGVPARIVVRPPLYPEPEPTPQATPGAPQGVVQGVAQPEHPQVGPLDVAKMFVPPIGNLKSLATGQPAPPMENFPATPGKIPEVGDRRWLSALGEAAGIGAGFVGPPLKAGAAAVGKFAPAIFAGPLAANANLKMLRQAEKLAAEGMSHADILKQTGWWLGAPDGKPRWEISDRLAKLKPQPRIPNIDENGNIVPVPLGEYVHHPELYKSYPGIENQVKVGALPLEWESRGIKGSYDPDTHTILVPWRGDPKQILSTILHELTHVVQEGPEKFAVGANMYEPHVQRLAEQLLPELQHKAQQAVEQLKAYRDAWIGKQLPMTPQAAEGWFNVDHPEAKQAFDYYQRVLNDPDYALQQAAHLIYMRHAGEAEARNVQKRQSMGTRVRRITPPSETQDFPNEQQIVMGAEQGTLRFRQDQPPGAPPPMGRNQPPPQYAMPPPANYPAALGRKLKRGPDVAAPKTEAIELAPGIFVGDVSLPQWIKRTETILSPEEIAQARKWYKEALPTYERYFGKEKGSAMLGAWLIANQNTSPSGAQLNAVRTLEQYLNRTGEFSRQKQGGLAHRKLMEYWDAILSDDPSKLKQAGTGQKIYDFVDSAAGKQTRTFYGDDPRAGAPAVADIHSYRDMGYVDEALHNWVRKTYGNKAARRITRDTRSFQGQREAPYEWAGDKMRRFADELNQMGYMGGNWTPAELQAVGWTVMSKMTGRKAETAEQAIKANIRNIGYELDFGAGAPYNQQFLAWSGLPSEEKTRISNAILSQIMDFAKEITGVSEFSRTAGTGGWGPYTNPSFTSGLIASPEVAGDVADIIGYLGQQTKIFGYRAYNSGNRTGVALYGKGLDDPAKVQALWADLHAQHPDFAAGFSSFKKADGTPGIEIVLDKGGEKMLQRVKEEMLPTLEKLAEKHDLPKVEIEDFRAQELSRSHDWQADPSGATGYLRRLTKRYGPDVQKRLDLYRREKLEPAIRAEIEKAGVSPLTFGKSPAEASGSPLWQHEIMGRARGGSLARGGAVQQKATKASVDYSRGMPAAHCGICKHYNDHACAKVRGYINPRFWCELFQKGIADAARRRDRSLALG